jgi:hypothetical protein
MSSLRQYDEWDEDPGTRGGSEKQQSDAAGQDQIGFVFRSIISLICPALLTLLCIGFAVEAIREGNLGFAILWSVFTTMLFALMWWMVAKLRKPSHRRMRLETLEVQGSRSGTWEKARPKGKRKHCPRCGSQDVVADRGKGLTTFHCKGCGLTMRPKGIGIHCAALLVILLFLTVFFASPWFDPQATGRPIVRPILGALASMFCLWYLFLPTARVVGDDAPVPGEKGEKGDGAN